MLFIVNKNSIAKQKLSSLETDLVESFEALVSVARRVLREEHQDNLHESNVNEDVKGTLRWLYINISYSSRTGNTSKSIASSSKHLLRPSDR